MISRRATHWAPTTPTTAPRISPRRPAPQPADKDDDLIKLVLSPPPSWVEHGLLYLSMSDNTILRLFDDAGVQIYDSNYTSYSAALMVDLDHPVGPLAGLAGTGTQRHAVCRGEEHLHRPEDLLSVLRRRAGWDSGRFVRLG